MDQINARPWDEGLEGAALRIAATNDTPLRVLAGPGTGKTFALMRRVARLLQDGADPNRILVCTFTRTAAADIKKELRKIGIARANDVHAGTLHSLCFSILQRQSVLDLTNRTPRPLLKFEVNFLIEDLKRGGFGGVRAITKRLLAFDAAWARRQDEIPGWPTEQVDREFQVALLNWMQFHKAMMLGELVPITLRYLNNNPLAEEKHIFDYILIDEYQDLNRAEQELVQLFSENALLTIVGDEDQSIYSFKYAHPQGIREFKIRHPETHDETLVDCRRCPQLVVEMANALIANNQNRTESILNALSTRPRGNVYLTQWDNPESEAEGLAKFVSYQINNHYVTPGEILIICPRQKLGLLIYNELIKQNILVKSFFQDTCLDGNPHEFQNSKPQQAFSLLTLLLNPNDYVALRCLCGFGNRSLNSGGWDVLRSHCHRNRIAPRAVLEDMVNSNLHLAHTGGILSNYILMKGELQRISRLNGMEFVDALFPPNQEWAEPFRSIISLIDPDEITPDNIYEVLKNNITQPELPTNVDYVRIMSLFKSKGLTADMVIITGFIQDLIPSQPDDQISQDEQEEYLEEQRRQFYVAITRTRNTLVISSFRHIEASLAHKICVRVIHSRGRTCVIASPFTNELSANCPRPIAGTVFLNRFSE